MKKVSSSQKGKLNVNGKSTVDKTFEQLYLSPTYISPDKHCNLEL